MKRKLCFIALFIIMVMGGAACSLLPVPELSDEYLVGLDYGGSSWGPLYDCIDARIIICTNRDVLVYMPTTSNERKREEYLEQIATLKLSEEQYNAINESLDREKLYNMQIGSNTDVCDGYSSYLILYGKDGAIVKMCGGYMPTSEKFKDMYNAVVHNIPGEEISALREEYLKELEEKEKTADDPELVEHWLKWPKEEHAKNTDKVLDSFKAGNTRAKYIREADHTSYFETKAVLSEGSMYTWDEIVAALGKVGNGEQNSEPFIQTGDVSYRLIDCGNDGINELCVEAQFNNEFTLHMIVNYIYYGLKISYIGDSWGRSEVSISENGVITSGGSAGATVHTTDYAYVDADGKYNFCYGVTQSLPIFESMYVQKDGETLVFLSSEGLDTEHLGLNEYRFEDENGNRTYCYEYFVVDDDYNDITTEADYSDSFELKKRFADLGIKTYTSGEIKELIEARKEEIQFPE